MVMMSAPSSNTDLVPYSERKAGLALRVEDAPLARQRYFENSLDEVRGEGQCEWCGSGGRRWSMYLKNVLHQPTAPDGRILPLKMCYTCCELELAESIRARLPDPESLFHPADISFRRDRNHDLGQDARPMSDLELRLYGDCGTAPRGAETGRVGFIVHDDAAAEGKEIIRSGD